MIHVAVLKCTLGSTVVYDNRSSYASTLEERNKEGGRDGKEWERERGRERKIEREIEREL